MTSSATYFAKLSTDELEQIFRCFLSKKHTHSLVLDPTSPFSSVLPNVITQLVLKCKTTSGTWSKENVHQLAITCTNAAEINGFRAELPRLQHVFKSIAVLDGGQVGELNTEEFSNVQQLQIVLDEETFHPGFIPKLGAQLQSFSLHLNGGFRGARRDNTCLSNLAATLVGHCSKIRDLTLQTPTLTPLVPLWKALGKDLQRLELNSRVRDGWTVTLQSLHAYCRGIRRIEVSCAQIRDDDIDQLYGQLLASYGAQLLEANLGIRSYESCAEVASHCPNVSVSLRTNMNDNLSRIALFGDRTTKLNISDDELSATTSDIPCRGLETLHMFFFNEVHRLQSLLTQHSKPHLYNLELTSRQPLHGALFQAMGAATGAVRQLRIRSPCIEGIAEFTRCNPHLNSVDICLSDLNGRDDHVRETLNVVRAVRHCIVLERLNVYSLFFPSCEWSRQLADAVVPLRQCRVSLLGRRYSR